jgi:hypothetical protein
VLARTPVTNAGRVSPPPSGHFLYEAMVSPQCGADIVVQREFAIGE